MADLTIDVEQVSFDNVNVDRQLELIASVDIAIGKAISINASGLWELADNSEAFPFFATDTVKAGKSLVGYSDADIDAGSAISGLAYGALVYTSSTAGLWADSGSAGDEVGFIIPFQERGRLRKILRLRAGELR